MNEAVIIDCLRTAVGKAPRGTLQNTRPDDLAAAVFARCWRNIRKSQRDEIDDVILGCANAGSRIGHEHGAHRGACAPDCRTRCPA